MFSYLRGELVEKNIEGIVIDVNGIGYEVRMPITSIDELPKIGNEIKVHTYMQVREDFVGLFGFSNREDLEMFKLLITVNGIGPKAGLGILSVISPDDLRFAVLSNDVKTISKAPGIGAKTASKLILELKDKLKLEDAFEAKLEKQVEGQLEFIPTKATVSEIRSEAIQALASLGYSNTDAARVVRKIEVTEVMTVEDVIKLSLKNLI